MSEAVEDESPVTSMARRIRVADALAFLIIADIAAGDGDQGRRDFEKMEKAFPSLEELRALGDDDLQMEIWSPYTKSLPHVALAAVEVGEIDRAVQRLAGLDPTKRPDMQKAISAPVQSSRPSRRLLSEMETMMMLDVDDLLKLAETLGRRGDFVSAKSIADASRFWTRDKPILQLVCASAAAAGHGEAALDWIKQFEAPYSRASMLCGLAKGIAPDVPLVGHVTEHPPTQ
jgi:hypothetical protein